MKVSENMLDLIGKTPMIKLNRFNTMLSFNLYVKCEMFNPTLSIKDRIVYHMILKFEQEGTLQPGMTIVEASSGNTGTAVAMIAAIKGYSAIICVPSKTSMEKINSMKVFGAEVIVSPPGVSLDSEEHYMNKAKHLASTMPNVILLGQYDSALNVESHDRQTAEEIWEQMDGRIDYLVATASSGGTITGVAKNLKQRNPAMQIIMPDPEGSIFYHYFKYGNMDVNSKPYKVEGAGKDVVCSIHDFTLIDDVIKFTDEDALRTTMRLAQTEGIFAGGSGAGALYVAEHLAYEEMKNKHVVVILPDSGFKYTSKF